MVEQMDLFAATNCEEPPKEKRVTEKDLQKKHDKKYKVRELTPSEWSLYRLIKHNSEVENRRTSQREICDKIPEFKWNDDEKAHDHCTAIWTAIKNNNESYEHEKLIISHNFEYWIGNKEETKVFLDKLWSDLEPRLIRYWKYLKKAKEDGQGRLLDKYGNPIDEDSDVRSFVESFLGEE